MHMEGKQDPTIFPTVSHQTEKEKTKSPPPSAEASTPSLHRSAQRQRPQLSDFVTSHDSDANFLLRTLRGFHPEESLEQVLEAYYFAKWAHDGTARADGRPYFTHPYDVALLVADHGMGPDAVAAALLHDVVEDEDVTLRDLHEIFGERVATMVNGLTKLKRTEVGNQDPKPATLKHILMESADKDPRILLIKTLDRYHNLRTLDVFRKKKQRRIARETVNFYIPLSIRLGLYRVGYEMQDQTFRVLHPKEYRTLQEMVQRRENKYRREMKDAEEGVRQDLQEIDPSASVRIAPKFLSEIRKYLRDNNLGPREMDSVPAFNMEVLLSSVSGCYAALGVLHSDFQHAQLVKDFIHNEKRNGYRSLHTTLFFPSGRKFHAILRTPEMERQCEWGVIPKIRYGGTLRWLKELVKDLDELQGSEVVGLPTGLTSPEIDIFTPAGERMKMPQGATALDFAYEVHTEVGNRAQSAKINGQRVPLKKTLKNNDTVTILTDRNSVPKVGWIDFVRTDRARMSIRRALRKADESAHMAGLEYITDYLGRFGLELGVLDERWEDIVSRADYVSPEMFWKDVGYGRLHHSLLLRFILPDLTDEEVNTLSRSFVKRKVGTPEQCRKLSARLESPERLRRTIRGLVEDWIAKVCSPSDVFELLDVKHPLPVSIKNCCHPRHDDELQAVTSRDGGAVVHRADCRSIRVHQTLAFRNLVEARWKREPRKVTYTVLFQGGRQEAMMRELVSLLERYHLSLKNMHISFFAEDSEEEQVEGILKIQAEETEDISRAFNKVRNIKGITHVDVRRETYDRRS